MTQATNMDEPWQQLLCDRSQVKECEMLTLTTLSQGRE